MYSWLPAHVIRAFTLIVLITIAINRLHQAKRPLLRMHRVCTRVLRSRVLNYVWRSDWFPIIVLTQNNTRFSRKLHFIVLSIPKSTLHAYFVISPLAISLTRSRTLSPLCEANFLPSYRRECNQARSIGCKLFVEHSQYTKALTTSAQLRWVILRETWFIEHYVSHHVSHGLQCISADNITHVAEISVTCVTPVK